MTQGKSSLGDLAFRAEGGDVGAQYRLGVIFLLGELAEKDTEAAYKWLVRAAVAGNEGAGVLVEKLVAGNLVLFAEKSSPGAGGLSGGRTAPSLLRKGVSLCGRVLGRILRRFFEWARTVWNRDFATRISATRLQPEVEPEQVIEHGNQAVQFQHPS